MSEQMNKIGKFIKINLQGLSISDYCLQELNKINITMSKGEFAIDVLISNTKHFIFKDNLYLITECKDLDGDIQLVIKESENNYSFAMSYYSGGTYLQECIEEELKRLDNIEEKRLKKIQSYLDVIKECLISDPNNPEVLSFLTYLNLK